MLRRRIPALVTALLVAMFAAQASYFAAAVNHDAPPDEWFHANATRIWASAEGFRVQDREGPLTYQFGPLSRSPFVYHWLMGKTLRAVYTLRGEDLDKTAHVYYDAAFTVDYPRYMKDVEVIRWASVAMATVGFACTAGFLFAAGASLPCAVVVLFFMATTLMYTFISGMANYDNLVIPQALGSFWLLALIARRATPGRFLALGALVLLGCLTKVVFLPLGAGIVIAAFALGRKALATREFWRQIPRTPAQIVGILAVLVLLRSNVRLYGANYARYQAIYPTCEDVIGAEICAKEYSQSIRDKMLIGMSAGQPRHSLKAFLRLYFKRWEETVVGIMSHRDLKPTQHERYPFRRGLSLCAAAIVFAAVRRRDVLRNSLWWAVLLVSSAYAAIVVLENYDSYLRLGVFGAGLQGRYWFPVLAPLIFVLHKPLFSMLKPKPAAFVAAAFVLVYSLQGFRIWMEHPVERALILKADW